MPNSPASIRVVISPELRRALDSHCRYTKRPLSDEVRAAIAERIGRPELAAVRSKGRPRKTEG